MPDNSGMIKKRTGEQEGNQALAQLIARAIEDSGLLGKHIAEMCGVKPQAVSNWKITGRIDKQNLEKLARLTGKSLQYFSTLSPNDKFYRTGTSAPTLQVAEKGARYHVGKVKPDAKAKAAKNAADARKLTTRILRLPPERRRLIEELVELLTSGIG